MNHSSSNSSSSLVDFDANGAVCRLKSPTAMPLASSYLWNKHMMMQVNCRGYIVSRFMQPEPTAYSHAPNLEAKTFMQPEQPYYAHHPGRFVYIKDLERDKLWSVPYEPCRHEGAEYSMESEAHCITWRISLDEIEVVWTLFLATDLAAEYWTLRIVNHSDGKRKLLVTPYFSVGYMSWMNQSAHFDVQLNSIVCESVTPYQKVSQYFDNKELLDTTFLWASRKPDAWQVHQHNFEGEGGLHNPSALSKPKLDCDDARYETPVAIMQYKVTLEPKQQTEDYRFIFGPAKSKRHIQTLIKHFQAPDHFQHRLSDALDYQQLAATNHLSCPDPLMSSFVNHWLSRQVHYHGDVNRLTTDPQTRNFLQDTMGLCWLNGAKARDNFVLALSQQHSSGAMPDGILLNDTATLKYINQVPHTDHCVWLPLCLKPYFTEHNDFEFLNLEIPYSDSDQSVTVLEHVSRAMDWLVAQTDHRHLSYIAQGDWCDPMNMVGYKGVGVSSWLTVASAYACATWANICLQTGHTDLAEKYRAHSDDFNAAFNTHCWTGDWYHRGISDDGIAFGTPTDGEGRIFLNPQTFALLSGASCDEKSAKMLEAVSTYLETPYGLQMLAPAYTRMHEHVGRVTQKFPGSAENGSVYNHAAAFYIYALYQKNEAELAFKYLRQMIPASAQEDLIQRGQLPLYVPNYYRGAYQQFPDRAGRSSQLFNTGTAAWMYRIVVECLFGLVGTQSGLQISPMLPSHWQDAQMVRSFRGAILTVKYERREQTQAVVLQSLDANIAGNTVVNILPDHHYHIHVYLKKES
ncbi:GH36-type glycosyl hydrolase domain-containing protein [Echinimonas agarilytica]|uniref:NdvB protein n=1 Tax=Echinimonas agarilytica TaxID=1215918 RepID=A0AA41WAA6_9GAMM|nr:NdvB protein [Echinimonas agarilytica]MCM2681212.1 NdvB protein [Echinimonas agarilytica]